MLLYRQGCYLREDEYICRSMGLVLNTRLKTPTGSVETESNTYIQSKNWEEVSYPLYGDAAVEL